MSIHEGHRERIKNRFRRDGLDNFDDVHVLELLLFYCIPQKDTNILAHRLIDHFGSLALALEAPAEELEKVEGIGKHASTFLNLITAVGRYYLVNRAAPTAVLNTTEQCGAFLLPYFYGRRNEVVYLLCLDAKKKVICCKEIGEGSVNSASISARKIIEVALAANSSVVILAHNHPSGLALPSVEDVQTTRRIARALMAVEIVLADHIVVADDDYVSLAQSGNYVLEEITAEMV